MSLKDKMYGAVPQTMGCLMERVVCSICGELAQTCEHTRAQPCDCDPDGQYDCKGQGTCGSYDGAITQHMVVEVSLVPASRCDECGEPMEGVNGYQWACKTEDCPAVGTPVTTGVMPFRSGV